MEPAVTFPFPPDIAEMVGRVDKATRPDWARFVPAPPPDMVQAGATSDGLPRGSEGPAAGDGRAQQ